jgi:hypothetical protein
LLIASGIDEAEAFFDTVQSLIDPVKATGEMGEGRSMLGQRVLDLADAEFQVFDVITCAPHALAYT